VVLGGSPESASDPATAESKDYQDIHPMLSEGISIPEMLGAAPAIYPSFNATITLKALTYFGDGPGPAPNLQRDLAEAAARVRSIPEILLFEKSTTPAPIAPPKTIDLDGFISPPRPKSHDLEPEI
jgi:hypothetical protein